MRFGLTAMHRGMPQAADLEKGGLRETEKNAWRVALRMKDTSVSQSSFGNLTLKQWAFNDQKIVCRMLFTLL